MLVVLATHPGDRYLTVPLAAHIRQIGGARNHDLLIVCPQGTSLVGIEDVFTQSFNRVHVFQYRETMRGWPWGANEAAYHIFSQVVLNNYGNYFLLLEPDCVLTSPQSLDYLSHEYIRCGAPIMGVTIPTVAIDTKQAVGKHTVGVAIYPRNFFQLCPLLKSVVRATSTYQQAISPMPWDAMFGPYTARMTAQTASIQHLQRTFTRDQFGMHWDCPSLENALQQANRGALLVHGCKHPEFLTRLTGGTPNAAEIRKGPLEIQHQGNDGRSIVQQSEETSRSEGSSTNGSSGSLRSIPKIGKSKEEIKEEKRLERARVKRIADLEAIRKEYVIEFEIDTLEWNRSVEIYQDQKISYSEVKGYARNLGIKASRSWKKGELICAIVKAEREERKEAWTAKLPGALLPDEPPVPPLPPEEQNLIIDPSLHLPSSVSPKVLMENETLVAVARPVPGSAIATGPAIAQIVNLGSMARPASPSGNGMTIDRTQQMMKLRMNRIARGLPT